QLKLAIHTKDQSISDSVEQGHAIATAINLARDYSNIPPNILTPAYYADLIQQHFSETEVIVDVKDSVTLQSEEFELVHAVGKASKKEPRIITLTYIGGHP